MWKQLVNSPGKHHLGYRWPAQLAHLRRRLCSCFPLNVGLVKLCPEDQKSVLGRFPRKSSGTRTACYCHAGKETYIFYCAATLVLKIILNTTTHMGIRSKSVDNKISKTSRWKHSQPVCAGCVEIWPRHIQTLQPRLVVETFPASLCLVLKFDLFTFGHSQPRSDPQPACVLC